MRTLIHYDNIVEVIVNDQNYIMYNLYKDTKTRTITNSQGFRKQITEILISPKTYWEIGSLYDHQFGGYDADCWLCGWQGMDYDDKCKCEKPHFTKDEHKDNLLKSRRNFLIAVIKNNFPTYIEIIKKLNDDQINSVLYDSKKQLKVYFPNFMGRETENKIIGIWLEKKLTLLGYL